MSSGSPTLTEGEVRYPNLFGVDRPKSLDTGKEIDEITRQIENLTKTVSDLRSSLSSLELEEGANTEGAMAGVGSSSSGYKGESHLGNTNSNNNIQACSIEMEELDRVSEHGVWPETKTRLCGQPEVDYINPEVSAK